MTASSTRTHLPVRIPMLPDEWPETYLVSLARAQGLRKPCAYDIELIRSVLPWESLRTAALDVNRNQRQGAYTRGRPQYGALPLPPWASFVRTTPLRYCPLCLAESRYIRTRWRLSGLQACTLHGCHLNADLAEQALTTGYARTGLLKLMNAEGQQIRDAIVPCLPREWRAASMIWQPLESLAQQSPSPREDDVLGTLVSWSVLAWRLLEEMSRVHHKRVIRQATSGPLSGVSRLIEELGVVAAPSEEGVSALLAGLQQNIHVLAAKRFFERVMREEEKLPTALSRLPLKSLSDRLASFAPLGTQRTSHGAMAFHDIREHALNKAVLMQDLAPLCGGAEVVNRWIEQKVIPSTKVVRGGKSFTFIERKHARQARKALLLMIHARDFVAQHHIDWSTYIAIRDTRLIRTGVLGVRGYLHRGDIATLMTRLELMSAPMEEACGLRWSLFCEATLHIAEQRGTFLALIEAAIQGQIKVFRDLSKPGLSAFSISVDGIVWLGGRRRAFFCERRWKTRIEQQGLFDAQEELAT